MGSGKGGGSTRALALSVHEQRSAVVRSSDSFTLLTRTSHNAVGSEVIQLYCVVKSPKWMCPSRAQPPQSGEAMKMLPTVHSRREQHCC